MGRAGVSDEERSDDVVERGLASAVSASIGRPVDVVRWSATPAAHRVTNMTTRALDVVTGVLTDGGEFSIFAKTLQPASASPLWRMIPPEHRDRALDDLDWTDEPRVLRCGLGDDLPAPLAMPRLLHVDERPDRTTLWMPLVADVTAWDVGRYERTAAALGAMWARWPEARAQAIGLGRRDIGRLFHGKIENHDLVIQSDPDFWSDPSVRHAVEPTHRRQLFQLAEAVPTLLERCRSLPHGAVHGDATPDNFREPGDGRIVAIDWSYGSVAPAGADLGQLLVGRVESGAEPEPDIERLVDAVVDGFRRGTGSEGVTVDEDDLELGFITHLAVRSAFSALLVEHRPDLDQESRAALVAARGRVAGWAIDRALRLAAGSA